MTSSLSGEEPCILVWGNASEGQLGIGDADEDVVEKPKILTAFTGIRELKIVQISCGWRHSTILLETGLVYSCGSNEYGQLGRAGSCKVPERIGALEAMFIKQVSCGNFHTLVLNDRGQVYAFGDNSKGQLGQGKLEEKSKRSPKIVKNIPHGITIALITSGGNHCLALSSAGQILCWGDNAHGQLGLGSGSKEIHPSPGDVLLSSGLPIEFLAAGESHSLAVTRSGTLLSWGRNSSGQLGLKDEQDRKVPTIVSSLKAHRVSHVACGDNHSVILTKSGRVFSFGDGSCGQLGHNSFNNESMPRQVLELMGSTVTHIACGRKHSLALVSSTGRLYASGNGTCGQLGSISKTSVKVPTVLNEGWNTIGANGRLKRYEHILNIASGGEHSFAVLGSTNSNAIDMRSQKLIESELFIDEARVEEIVQRFKHGTDVQSLRRDTDFLQRIFASQACLNGSFLREQFFDQMDVISHNVNMPAVRRSLTMLYTVPSFSNAILKVVRDRLIPSLTKIPLDIEGLRIYLILPELPSFMNEDLEAGLTVPFGNSIVTLFPSDLAVLVDWWKTLPASFFSKVIEVFQCCVKSALKTPFDTSYQLDEWFSRHAMLTTCMEILKMLYGANEDVASIVPYTTFYIPEIQQRMDIQVHFVNWIQQPNMFSFFLYPFVFDTKAKSILLQTDVLLQMRSAVDEVQRVNLHNMFSGALHGPLSPMLTLHIRRDHLKEDALREITMLNPFEFKKPLKVVFDGEEGVDAGGVKKEFFYLLLREIVHPKYGMFVEMEESKVIWFNQQSFEGPEMYLLIGIVCGLAIYNSTIINVDFPPVLYKKLLRRKPNLDDFRDVQPNVSRNLQYLLDYSDDDVESVFDLTFQISIPFYGTVQNIDLIPGGGDVLVNSENKEHFVTAYIDYFLNSSISNQFAAFSEGFHRVCSGKVLGFFHPQELMEMVVGCQEYNFKELEEGTVYKGEYYRNHAVIVRFWDVFDEFTLEKKKKFLAFLTGSYKVPIYGMKSLQFTIQPMSGGEAGDYLPVAHTCFNILDLPRYETKDIMRRKLTQAIEFSEGFGLA